MLYPADLEHKLGFDSLRVWLADLCLSPQGAARVAEMQLLTDPDAINRELDMADESKAIQQELLDFPTDSYNDLSPMLLRLRPQGAFPTAEDVHRLRQSLGTMRSIAAFFRPDDRRRRFPALTEAASTLKQFPQVYALADAIVDKNGDVKDSASPELGRIRSEIAAKQAQVSKVVNRLLRLAQASGWADAEALPTIREGKLLIPVQSQHKRQLPGIVHDESTSGKTVYIEPAESVTMNNDLREALGREKREIRRILIAFADAIRPDLGDLMAASELMGLFDFERAKGLAAIELDANRIIVSDQRAIRLIDARNPILVRNFRRERKRVVPLEVDLDDQNRILLVSGPNAGGKSVALKTIGILQYMTQCGMLIPASGDSRQGIFTGIFVNIGDDQSVDNDLSTYSSHLLHMKNTLRGSGERSLVLIDEFGGGTEPVIGGGIAEAILDKLNQKGVFGVITTHYSNLKHYASQTQGIVNGAMMFDTSRIEPTFRLEQGKPGGSFAIEIAHKIGLPADVIEDAKRRAGDQNANFDKHLREIQRDKRYWEEKREQIHRREKEIEEALQRQVDLLAEAKAVKDAARRESREAAEKSFSEANRQIENIIREIKHANAEKEATRVARERFRALREQTCSDQAEAGDIDEKINQATRMAKRHGVQIKTAEKEKEHRPLQKGDFVTIDGQQNVGQIQEIKGKRATVAFGSVITTIDPARLVPVSNAQARQYNRAKNRPLVNADMGEKRLAFRPYIDVRGKYAEEAIVLVNNLIDEAVMFDATQLRILHGRGNGILRSVLRQHLKGLKHVASIADEHVEHGGDGITIVTLS